MRIAFLGLGIVLLLAGLALAALFTMPSFERTSPRGSTRDASPTLELTVAHAWGLDSEDVTATVDGRDVSSDATVRGRRVLVELPRLADGQHEVEVSAAGLGPLHRTLATSWTLEVDTTAPGAGVRLPKAPAAAAGLVPTGMTPLRSRTQPLAVRTEPGASVEASSDAAGTTEVRTVAGDDGIARLRADLAEGAQRLEITSTDAVGNVSTFRARLLVDSAGPTLASKLPGVTRDATLALAITLRDPRGVDTKVVFDGGADGIELIEVDASGAPIVGTEEAGATAGDDVADVASRDAEPDAEQPTDQVGGDVVAGVAIGVTEHAPDGAEEAVAPGAGGDDDTGAAPIADDARGAGVDDLLPTVARYRLSSDADLYEGRHELTITARDALGNETRVTRAIIVDSSERLTDVEGLRKGARGADVRELHMALIKAGATTRAKLGADFMRRAYGQPSRAAVSAYQTAHTLDVDGMAGRATIASLLFRIVVDQATHTLTLYSGDTVVKRYGVAVGQPAYPTPKGEFHIVSMQENPTWTPPDSVWAKGAKPIGPGPDNPLGTRWMGLDAPGGTVGIHGTNNPSSIGGSVSHGCIRMKIPDAEDLFDRVEPGTPVIIQ